MSTEDNNVELPGVPAQQPARAFEPVDLPGSIPPAPLGAPSGAPAKSQVNTLVVSLVAVIAVLVIALVFALVRPWDNGPGASSSGTNVPAPAPAESEPAPAPTTAPLDDYQQAEADMAAKHGWVAGEDYLPSQAQNVRQMIAALPTFESAGLTEGSADAPVDVRVFGDFSCPVCAQLHAQSGAALEEYAASGMIQLEWINFVIFDADYQSNFPALGAVAAGAQGMGWDFVDIAYTNPPEGNHPTWSRDVVVALAEQIGIPDMAKFEADLDAAETAQIVTDQSAMSQGQVGLGGTPAVIINGVFFGGLYPQELMANSIELQAELAAAGYDWAA